MVRPNDSQARYQSSSDLGGVESVWGRAGAKRPAEALETSACHRRMFSNFTRFAWWSSTHVTSRFAPPAPSCNNGTATDLRSTSPGEVRAQASLDRSRVAKKGSPNVVSGGSKYMPPDLATYLEDEPLDAVNVRQDPWPIALTAGQGQDCIGLCASQAQRKSDSRHARLMFGPALFGRHGPLSWWTTRGRSPCKRVSHPTHGAPQWRPRAPLASQSPPSARG